MIKRYSKKVSKCQISNSKNLKSLIFLGYLPPVNTLRKIGSKKRRARKRNKRK